MTGMSVATVATGVRRMTPAQAGRVWEASRANQRWRLWGLPRRRPALVLVFCTGVAGAVAWAAVESSDPAAMLESGGIAVHGVRGSGSISEPSGERDMSMKYTNSRSLGGVTSVAALSALAIAGSVHAQDAVQWRVEDGGNGHWYARTSEVLVWPQLQAVCVTKGGHLATVTTLAEWTWLKARFPISYFEGRFAGAYQDHSDPLYAEPNGGWHWVTGESFQLDLNYMGTLVPFANMTEPGFDDCPAGTVGYCGCGPDGAQDVLFFTGCCNNILDDVGDGIVQNCDSVARSGFIEWSADCNADGIVDYGQILAGDLIDANLNGIPDICEADPCPADVILTGSVDAVDLAAMLGAWGTDGGDYPRADIDRDGIVSGPDLGALLGGWGKCP